MNKKKVRNKWLKITTRVVGMDPITFQESWRFKINRLQILSLLMLILFVFFVLFYLIFSYTPLGQILPENIKNRNKEKIESTLVHIDKLERSVSRQEEYIKNLQNIILGKISIDSVYSEQELEYDREGMTSDTSRSQAEKELEERINSSSKLKNKIRNNRLDDLFLFDPVKGVISQKFDKKNHFGVDIIAKKNESVHACLDGIILNTSYDHKYGYTIVINHQNDITSVYKHLEKANKKSGDFVKTGDLIGIVGNTGERTTGPHLHFELWSNLGALNPLDYLSFGQ